MSNSGRCMQQLHDLLALLVYLSNQASRQVRTLYVATGCSDMIRADTLNKCTGSVETVCKTMLVCLQQAVCCSSILGAGATSRADDNDSVA